MTMPDQAAAARADPLAYLLLTLTALCWGANAVFGRLAVGEVSPMVLTMLRWLLVLALLVPLVQRQVRRDWPVLRRHLPFLAVMGALGFTGFNAVYYVAAHDTTAVNIGILQGSIPVFVLIGAFAAYRTAVSPLQVGGVAVTMLGVVLVGTGATSSWSSPACCMPATPWRCNVARRSLRSACSRRSPPQRCSPRCRW
jgi:drug/metabolite transporter (DMT)-like permease